MITRIEIDGFKTFDKFGLDLRPFTAIVGPNASGKSNLFDALRLISALAETDIRSAMQDLRGEPEELFRQTLEGLSDHMSFAVEVFLDQQGIDDFGRTFRIPAQRLRYEIELGLSDGSDGSPRGVFVRNELCRPLARYEDRAEYLRPLKPNYNARVAPFIRRNDSGDSIEVRQDGRQKRGRPVQYSLREASRSALSTIATAEFPHLYALRTLLMETRFLEINPKAARGANDRFESSTLKSDASNLAAVLTHLKNETGTELRPNGVLSDIALDLTALIPAVADLLVQTDTNQRQYSFSVGFSGNVTFSSRVISDGTLRLLALLTVLNDPGRRGTLCFEEPENGVHEGRIPMLVQFLRDASALDSKSGSMPFQVLLNTHSPKVMSALQDVEIIAADMVTHVDSTAGTKSYRTRMRAGVENTPDLLDPELYLVRAEVERLLQNPGDAL
ncbi:MAG: AAA family ATPase [Pseudomonadota bacterium]